MVAPNFDKVQWVDTANGWKCTQPDASMIPDRYLRQPPWSSVGEVLDSVGRKWYIPRILADNGAPMVAQRMRRVSGEWVREAVSNSQEAAISAAITARNAIENDEALSVEDMCEMLLPLLEVVYHLDADTIGATGIVDDVLISHGLRFASGKHNGLSDAV